MHEFPAGTVTFLFTDIEGSTRLLEQLGDEYATLLADQRSILRGIFSQHDGQEVDTQGDSFFYSFPRASQAINAAVEAQRVLQTHAWPKGVELRVRMGLHTGEPLTQQEGYVGMDVHRAARIASSGHGGQILISESTAALIMDQLPLDTELSDLGHHLLKDFSRPEHIRQVVIKGFEQDYPPLRSVSSTPQVILQWQQNKRAILRRTKRFGIAGAVAMMIASSLSIIQMEWAVPDWFSETTMTVPIVYWWIVNLLTGLIWGGTTGLGIGLLLSIGDIFFSGKDQRMARALLAVAAGEIHAMFIIFTAYQGGTWINSSPSEYIPAYLVLGLIFGLLLNFMIPRIDKEANRNQLIIRASVVAILFALSSVIALLVAYQMAIDSFYLQLDAVIFISIAILYPTAFLVAIAKERPREPISEKEERRWSPNYPIT